MQIETQSFRSFRFPLRTCRQPAHGPNRRAILSSSRGTLLPLNVTSCGLSSAILSQKEEISCFSVLSPCACRKLDPYVLVMQSTQDRTGEYATNDLDGARNRRVFVQG